MSGGKTKSKSTSKTTLSPFSQQQWTSANDAFQSEVDGYEFTPYSGDLSFTGFTDAGQKAKDTVMGGGFLEDARGLMTDDFDPMLYGEAVDQTRGNVKGFGDFDTETYVNPHANEMIGAMTGDIEEAAARARTSSDSQALANSAYGGSRHGVRDGMIDESMLDTIADTSANIRFNTWDRGADRFYQDQSNQMQLGNMDLAAMGMQNDAVANQAGFLAGLDQSEVDNLLALDGIEAGRADRNMGLQYQEALREQEDDWRRILMQLQARNSVPLMYDTTGTNTQKSNPGAYGWAGMALDMASLGFGPKAG